MHMFIQKQNKFSLNSNMQNIHALMINPISITTHANNVIYNHRLSYLIITIKIY